MANKKLVRHVTVHDDNGVTHGFGPGDDVPAWAVKKITNTKVWGDDTADSDDSTTGNVPDGEPPRTGKGSGEKAWRAYATEVLELEVPEDANRDDIIALVDEHNADA